MNRSPFLFFDCWYTLFQSDLGAELERIAQLLGRPYNRLFMKQFERAFMTQAHADHRLPAADFLQSLGLRSNPAQIAAIETVLAEGLDRQLPYDDTLATLDHLGSNYRLGLITNSTSQAFERLNATFNLSARFDIMVTSYAVGVIKPDPAIFQTALSQAKVESADAIMVGDALEDDYQAARHLGLQAILLDRRGRYPHHPHRITQLAELENALTSAKI
jgi:putative hydrolase of the HAD superfamily